jgi:riboflavin synthase
MFTGLVMAVGEVSTLESREESAIITITSPTIASQVKIGDSIAVNGVCLTATSVSEEAFTADVMVQTLRMSSLGGLGKSSQVNLELAAKVSDRLGGHIVQGHVDGVGKVALREAGEKWEQMDITVPAHLMKYIQNQGSICIDGVSLTVGSLEDEKNQVTLWLIPETLAKTNLSTKKIDDQVNIEVDVLAKYVERLAERKVLENE